MRKRLDTTYVYLELEDDLLIGYYKKDKKTDLNAAKQIVRDRLALTEGHPVLALAINLGVRNITKEARDYLASKDGVKSLIAGAIIVGSPVGSVIGNWLLSLSKPLIPSRAFTKKEAAIRWLQQFRK
jgi:hypothetical protein